MLFPVALFLAVLSPLFIPIAVTAVHVLGNLRTNPAVRPFRQFRQAVSLVTAAVPAAA